MTIGEQVIYLEKIMKNVGFVTYLDFEEGITREGINHFCKKHKVEYNNVTVIDNIVIGVFTFVGISDIITREGWVEYAG